jgi:peroxiredoxin/outer membrane lipoprotein-sorting protein
MIRRLLLIAAALAAVVITPQPASSQASGDAVLARFKRVVAKTQSLKASLEMSITVGKSRADFTGTVALLRPTYALIRTYRAGKPDRVFAANGTSTYEVQINRQRYRLSQASERGEALTVFAGPGLTPLSAFFAPNLLAASEVKYAGPRTLAGRKYEVLTYKGDRDPETATYYFGPTGYLEGVSMLVSDGDARQSITVWLRKLQLDAPLGLEQFAYAPPPEFEPIEAPDPSATLLTEGEDAPDFTLPKLGGGKVALSALRKHSKAVLVSFWFLDCTPCKAELPIVQALYKAYRAAGLELVLINSGDAPQRIQQYLKDSSLELPVVLGGAGEKFTVGKAYGVQAFPVSYLIGQDGTILWRGIGLDETALKLALKDAGIA